MAELINLNPKLATDLFVRLGDTVRALGELHASDVSAAKLVMESTGDPLSPVAALDQLIALLQFIREDAATEERRNRMIAFARVLSTHLAYLSPRQVYSARSLAEESGNHAAQNILERVLDAVVWPMAVGGVTCGVAVPGIVVTAACAESTKSNRGIQTS